MNDETKAAIERQRHKAEIALNVDDAYTPAVKDAYDILQICAAAERGEADTKRLYQTIKKLCLEIRAACPDGMLVKRWIDDAEVEADAAMKEEK